ncbi:MAG: hypothetical protein Greene041619_635 [Candidatus Peregrinibacteria bacterium Greene0416_19]|nr:MAG: hypothetical protein Greene041619_635 [Candidatus Peregrinibacteria bacterium Greene0416_19]
MIHTSFLRCLTASFLILGFALMVSVRAPEYAAGLTGQGVTVLSKAAPAVTLQPGGDVHLSAPALQAGRDLATMQLIMGMLLVIAGCFAHTLSLLRRERLTERNHDRLMMVRVWFERHLDRPWW